MLAYVFPGQGSQQKGMGKEIFDEYKEYIAIADKILGYSIKEMCMEDSDSKLEQTQFTQPVLYVINTLSYLKKIKDDLVKPDYLAGHSLGEYSALFAAGVFDFETGLKIVKKRGELMSQATYGGMAAIIGFTSEKIKEILQNYKLNTIDIANLNTPTQIVISGPIDNIRNAKDVFEKEGVKAYIILKVSGAFHSRYMSEARDRFELFLEQFKFNKLTIPVIANLNARPYKDEEVRTNIINQITHSVRWCDSIRYLMGKEDMEIIQVGPGTVISELVKSIQDESEPKKVDESDRRFVVRALSLGDKEFKKDYNLKYAYLTGGMYRGVASKEMVVKMGKAGMMGFLGTGGLEVEQIESKIKYIQKELCKNQAYGMNFLANMYNPLIEEKNIDLFIKYGIRNIEASAFINMTPALVRYRVNGLKYNSQGIVTHINRIIAKVSRPEVAEVFLSPPPKYIIEKLLMENKITHEEAIMSSKISMCDDLCVEADSGGHTDHGVAYVLMPVIIKLRDEMMKKFKYAKEIRVGAAGGIGTPEAALAAFMLGADFILTGSINQCTVEADTSDSAKDLLQQMNVQDTEYAPAGDMFEIGAKVQVLKKGLFFPSRANKLYDLYKRYKSLDEIDEKTRNQIQDRYFKRSFNDVYEETRSFFLKRNPKEIEKAEKNPKYKMALIFRWYFNYSSRLALSGNMENKVDYQVHCGPALGAFNQWIKGTEMEDWKNRNVDKIAVMIMVETAKLLENRFNSFLETS
ncbi:ACP S-malonyltransferase [Clostridium estertheticum]|uniref:ACP S-malonyltransferase n=1 Tax=Clostridium estertheticum TaxID=238834 RepID=UPI001C0B8FDB|nr:ACP S-malonyltransferase [Clostridium estertheticum]MBU3187803.1 ACP S-malonyltransferase [Clostridium estertheticum]